MDADCFSEELLDERFERTIGWKIEPGECDGAGGHAAEKRRGVVGLGKRDLLVGDLGRPEFVGLHGLGFALGRELSIGPGRCTIAIF